MLLQLMMMSSVSKRRYVEESSWLNSPVDSASVEKLTNRHGIRRVNAVVDFDFDAVAIGLGRGENLDVVVVGDVNMAPGVDVDHVIVTVGVERVWLNSTDSHLEFDLWS